MSFLIPTLDESFAESQYATSHFYSKGDLTSIVSSQPAVVWTMIDGDKGTIVSSYEGVNSITRLDIQPHPECLQHKDLVCMEGIITDVKNSKISKIGDKIVMKYEIPYSQSITFFDGSFAGTTFVVDLSKFDARDASRIIKQQADKEVADELQKESYLRIVDGRHLLRNSVVQDQLMGSYLRFGSLGNNASSEIEKMNQEWVDAKPGVSPLENAIINNKVSDLLREEMERDSNRPVKFIIKEIILTDVWGTNVAQTGPTTDYMQKDEQWWISAKEEGFHYQSGFDESAGIHSFDISMRVISDKSMFFGVIKFVIDTEPV